jgi:FKBP-type peptidyl-prolyl cis-trans isomerase
MFSLAVTSIVCKSEPVDASQRSRFVRRLIMQKSLIALCSALALMTGAGACTKSVKELKTEDTQVGTGAEAVAGKTVTVHYTGTLQDGKKFDSSLDRGQPFRFQLGAGQVISGWDKGIVGMKVGGKRKLSIPSDMAYGESGRPPVIPPNSPLFFDVELLNVE